MPRTDEAATFFNAVYSAVQEIPYGKVTSYGHIAKLIGTRERTLNLTRSQAAVLTLHALIAQRPRQVGICLKHLSSDPDSHFNSSNVPWQRVISSKGTISPRGHPSGAAQHAAVLGQEGVIVTRGNMGEFTVDLNEYGWFVRQLPSEVAAGLTVSVEDEQEV